MTDIDRLLARPMPISERFEIDNIASLADAITRPPLAMALEDFHDRLYWSKNKPEAVSGSGTERFTLVHRFIEAEYPIRAMPPTRTAAEQVWDAFMLDLEPQMRAVMRKANYDRGHIASLPPVLLSGTIHGTRTLIANSVKLRRKMVRLFRHSADSDAHFNDYAERALKSVYRSADHYDPRRGIPFTSFAHKGIKGAFADWREHDYPHSSVSMDGGSSWNRSGYTCAVTGDDVVGGYSDTGIAPAHHQHLFSGDNWRRMMDTSAHAVPTIRLPGDQPAAFYFRSDPTAVHASDMAGRIIYGGLEHFRWGPETRQWIKAEANLTEQQSFLFDNEFRDRPYSPLGLAQILGIPIEHVYVLRSRTLAKLRPVLHRRFFVRKSHD